MGMNQNVFAIGDLYLNKGHCFIFWDKHATKAQFKWKTFKCV